MKLSVFGIVLFASLIVSGKGMAENSLIEAGHSKPVYRIELSSGFSSLLSSDANNFVRPHYWFFDSNEESSYYKKLSQGFEGEFRIHRIFENKYGLGIVYQFNRCQSNTFTTLEVTDGFYKKYGELNDHITTNFIGLSLMLRTNLLKNGKLKSNIETAFGPIWYRNDYKWMDVRLLNTSTSAAYSCSAGLEYFLSKGISLGVKVTPLFSEIKDITSNDGNTKTHPTFDGSGILSRISLSGFLSIQL